MPSTRAARASCAVARIACPMRLFFMNTITASASTTASPKPMTRVTGIVDQSAGELPGRQTGLRRLGIRAEREIQALLDHDGDAEGGEQRGEQIARDHLADHQAVDHPADPPQQHEGARHAEQRMDAVASEAPGADSRRA